MKIYPRSVFEGFLVSWSFLPMIFDMKQRKKSKNQKAAIQDLEPTEEMLSVSTKYNDMYLQQALAGTPFYRSQGN